jgi:hypothetical protein
MKSGSLDGAIIPKLLQTTPSESGEIPVLDDQNVSSIRQEDHDAHNGESNEPNIRIEEQNA